MFEMDPIHAKFKIKATEKILGKRLRKICKEFPFLSDSFSTQKRC